MKLRAIGTARSEQGRFRIELEGEFRKALNGLESFSHAIVVRWTHGADSESYRRNLVLTKPYTKGPDSIGVFATRSPARPNTICLTAVPIMSVDEEKGVLNLYFHDCLDGTPVLDIKPYHPLSDLVPGAT
jgi:tRNA-Thr(GGU) m(6)t(6)A37 methyltransferase TsaA